jgi:DnaD/phage-associated family protein
VEPATGEQSAAARFIGFPAKARATAIPNVFFSDLLPQLAGDVVSLGVTFYAFKCLQSKRGSPRFLSAAELVADAGCAAFLAAAGGSSSDVAPGLRRATEIGVLLTLTVENDGSGGARSSDIYFLNTPSDRRGMEAVRNGTVDLGRVLSPRAPDAERSSVFQLYESLIGTVSPLIADDLAEAERLYPAEWLAAAFREAASQNARSWRYVSRILERWAIEGPDHAKTGRDPAAPEDRYFRGKYGRILKQRLQP